MSIRLSILSFFFCFLLSQLSAQTILYPIKKDHRWGYMNKRGKIVVEPKYDLIGASNLPWAKVGFEGDSPFKFIEYGQKMGVVNELYEEILPPMYQGVRPLSHHYFAVKDSLDSDYYVVNARNEVVFSTTYPSIHYLGMNETNQQPYFLVQKGDLKGVCTNQETPILPIRYDRIKMADSTTNIFQVALPPTKEELNNPPTNEKGWEVELWALVNDRNEIIIEKKCLEVKICHPNFIGYKELNHKYWQACDSLGKMIYPPVMHYFRGLNKTVMEMRNNTSGALLFHFEKQDTIPPEIAYAGYEPLDERFIKVRSRSNLRGMMDNDGRAILAAEYNNILPARDSFYVVIFNRQRGLWHIRKGMMVEPGYDEIIPFQDGLAKVRLRSRWGCLNEKGEEVIPTQFSEIFINKGIVKAYNGSQMQQFEVNEQGEVIGYEQFASSTRFRVTKKLAGAEEAKKVKREREIVDENRYYDEYPSPFEMPNSPWKWRVEKIRDVKHYSLKNGTLQHPELTGKTWASVAYIERTRMSLHAPHQEVEALGMRPISSRLVYLYPKRIFFHDTENFKEKVVLLGLRRHDFERNLPFASAINLKGKFVLIDHHGELQKNDKNEPLQFTYIGEFENGIARACIGGELANLEDLSQFKYHVLAIPNFVEHYHLRAANDKQKSAKGLMLVRPDEAENVPLWGFIDTLGNWIIKPEYAYVSDNKEGQAVAVKEGKWGVIDLTNNQAVLDFKYARVSPYYGAWKINDRSQGLIYFNQKGWQISSYEYSERGRFENGFCAVKKEDKWGYIGEEGTLKIDCQFQHANSFAEERAAVKIEGTWSIIDTSGQVLKALSPSIDTLGNYQEGYIWFKSGKLYGFLDKIGEIAIPASYQRVFPFQHGVARAVEKGKMGLLNTNGVWMAAPKYYTIDAFDESETVAVVQPNLKPNKLALISSEGELLTEAIYTYIGSFSEGVATVSDGRYYGFINAKGELIGKLNYTAVSPFSDGVGAGKSASDGKWHFFDTTGRILFRKELRKVGLFYDGMALVNDRNNRQLLINKRGEKIKDASKIVFVKNGIIGQYSAGENQDEYFYTNLKDEPLFTQKFDEIYPFEGDLARVRKTRRLGVVNKRGNFVIRPKYFYLKVLEGGQIAVGPPAFGIANRKGEVLIEPIYDNIELMTGNIYRLEQGEKVGYTKDDGTVVWELQN